MIKKVITTDVFNKYITEQVAPYLEAKIVVTIDKIDLTTVPGKIIVIPDANDIKMLENEKFHEIQLDLSDETVHAALVLLGVSETYVWLRRTCIRDVENYGTLIIFDVCANNFNSNLELYKLGDTELVYFATSDSVYANKGLLLNKTIDVNWQLTRISNLENDSADYRSQISQLWTATESKSNATNIQNGSYTNSLIQKSIIEGTETSPNIAGQWWATTFGRANTSGENGYAAFTCGTRNVNNGDSAFVTGISNTLSNNAWGAIIGGAHNTVDSAYESLTVGEYNQLTSDATYAGMFGHHNQADGSGGLTFGRYNYNYTTNGFCGGEHNNTNIHHRAVLGKYNNHEEESGKTRLFEVGNGYVVEEYEDIGTALRPNNEWDFALESAISTGQMYIDFKFTGTISADVRTQFCLGDGSTFGGWYRVNSNGTLNQTYSGLSIARIGTTNWYRITIDVDTVKPSEVSSISTVRFRGNFSDATGFFRVNPELVEVEHRQNAFEVLADGTLRIPNFNTDGSRNGYKNLKCINGVLTVID